MNEASNDTIKSSDKFAHLHLHSVYSLLDGAIRIKDLVKEVKKMGMDSVAVTDHGNMFGAIDFYQQAKAEGIKPILGCEFYVSPSSRFDKGDVPQVKDGSAYHMILLAKNKQGYKNLIKLNSKAYTEGFYRKPRIDYELLADHTAGLIGTTACIAGEVNRKLINGDNQGATQLAGHLNEMFEKDSFYLEIQNHGIEEQAIAAKGSVELSKKLGIPLVLANDAHFLRKEDQKAQEVLLRIQMNKKIDDPLDFGFNSEFYVKSPQEMKLLFPELPEAFHNTQKIADMTDIHMEFGHPLLPDFETPGNMSLTDYLLHLSNQGLKRHLNNQVTEKYQKRLNFELNVIKNMGFDGYFLIVADFIEYARKKGIPVGPGRGSAAGSLVAYCLGITNIDPLRYDLLFERFLNPARNEMPDIDIDFCRDRREEVIDYVIQKYGKDKVSQIITFGTLSAKAVIKDVARVLGFDFQEMNSLSKHFPDTPGVKLEDAIKGSQEIQNFFKRGEKEKQLWQISKSLEGIPRNSGKHAAGVVIAPDPLDEIVPLAVETKTGSVITQYEKGPLEQVGLVKMDFLGLKNLTVIQMAVDEIKRRKTIVIDINKIPLDDKEVYQLLRDGKTKGVFQIENVGITNLIIKAKPDKFEDIVACIALYRPGPLQAGMTDDYIKRRNGEEEIIYPHENLKEVLKDTLGTIVYQEQVMLISQIVGGFTMAEADTLRKAMGKKKEELIAQMKQQFIEGAKKQDYQEKWASDLYDSLAEFAKYGFNKSHSAAYGLITYQTAYLKTHHTIEFMKATLDAEIEKSDKLIGFISATRELGIHVLPPDVNESDEFFTIIDDKTIRFGLLGIKGLGKAAVDALLIARNTQENKKFKSLLDFISTVDPRQMNKKVLESLTKAGALDNFIKTRSAIFSIVDDIIQYGAKQHNEKSMGQDSLFGAEVNESASLTIPQIKEWNDKEKLIFEKETLGLYLTSHPIDKYQDLLKETKITSIANLDDGISKFRQIKIMGVIESIKFTRTKRSSFYVLRVSDISGLIEVRVYENLYKTIQEKNLLVANEIVIITCKVSIFRDEDTTTVIVNAKEVFEANYLMNIVNKSLHLLVADAESDTVVTKINNIKVLLKQHTGENPVYIHYKNIEKEFQVMKVHPSYYVDYNDNLNNALKILMTSPKHVVWEIAGNIST